MPNGSSAKKPAAPNSGTIVGGFGLLMLLVDGHHAAQVIGDSLRQCECSSIADFLTYVYRLEDVKFTGLVVHVGICLAAAAAIGFAAWNLVRGRRSDD
jgi:hypothetical protein